MVLISIVSVGLALFAVCFFMFSAAVEDIRTRAAAPEQPCGVRLWGRRVLALIVPLIGMIAGLALVRDAALSKEITTALTRDTGQTLSDKH